MFIIYLQNSKPSDISKENEPKSKNNKRKVFQVSITKLKEYSSCLQKCYTKQYTYTINNNNTTSNQARNSWIEKVSKGEVRRKIVFKNPYSRKNNSENCYPAILEKIQQKNETNVKICRETNIVSNKELQTDEETKQKECPKSVKSAPYCKDSSDSTFESTPKFYRTHKPSVSSFLLDHNYSSTFNYYESIEDYADDENLSYEVIEPTLNVANVKQIHDYMKMHASEFSDEDLLAREFGLDV
ncbi:hypothetical protein NPIL_494621 [Nephila pilipes]|uniref:Uncharacterized protein n=1 Tax=Nephila pilipes TaxID=299642 RepID=A0A8X6T796_NEPPI|nr:hypothetical protein NPIL_494621 [Nephila pilipes]